MSNNSDMLKLMKLMESAAPKFAGEPEQQPGDQVRGTDVAKVGGKDHPFKNRLVGEDTALEDKLSKKYQDFKDVQAKEKEQKKKDENELDEGKWFKTDYGWAGGSKPGGGTYKHPDTIKAEKAARKKAKQEQDARNKSEQSVTEGRWDSPASSAITRRILNQRTDLLQKFGPEAVMHAIDEVAEWHSDVEEIGSSDVSGWVNQVARMLQTSAGQGLGEGVAEGTQRVDSLVTDALKIMRGPTMDNAIEALETVLGKREYKDRRDFYKFYINQILDMYSQQGVSEANNDTGVKWFDFATWALKQGDKYKDLTTNHAVHQAAQKAYKAYVKSRKQGVTEGVAESMPMSDAVKVLRHYGADHFKTGSETLQFYKNGKPFSVDLIWNDDSTRSVSLSQLNAATRGLKGQGVTEDYDDEDGEGNEGFFVALGSEDNGGFVGMINKDGGKWRESKISGNAPHNWGGNYMSYLTTQDVMQHIKNDYGRHYDVAGPFDSQEEAQEYASMQYGLDDGMPEEFRESEENPYGYKVGQTVKLSNGKRGQVLDIFDDSIEVMLPGGQTVTVAFQDAEVLGEAQGATTYTVAYKDPSKPGKSYSTQVKATSAVEAKAAFQAWNHTDRFTYLGSRPDDVNEVLETDSAVAPARPNRMPAQSEAPRKAWADKVVKKFPGAKIMMTKTPNGPAQATLNGKVVAVYPEKKDDSSLTELSPATLSSYKQKAGAAATAADKRGEFEKGHKRFKGIVKATLKQFANDEKGVREDSNPTDTITMDIPLFIRMMEYSREDAQSDMDLHSATEKITKLSASGQPLTMQHYDEIVGMKTEQQVNEFGATGSAVGSLATQKATTSAINQPATTGTPSSAPAASAAAPAGGASPAVKPVAASPATTGTQAADPAEQDALSKIKANAGLKTQYDQLLQKAKTTV